MSFFSSNLLGKISFLVVTAGGIGSGISSLTNYSFEQVSLSGEEAAPKNDNKKNLLKSSIDSKSHSEDKKQLKPFKTEERFKGVKQDEIIWEFVLFNPQGERLCEAGNYEWASHSRTKKPNCDREWMQSLLKKHSQGNSELWLRYKVIKNDWSQTMLNSTWNREINKKGGGFCIQENLTDDIYSVEGWKILHCTSSNKSTKN